MSRWTHFRAALSRQARGRRKDSIAIVLLAIIGVVMMLGIFVEQKAALPSWVPFVGRSFEHVTAEFSSAQAVTPGQGQAVTIAGIEVGKVSSVNLEEGHAIVGMDIEPKYMKLIHPDATLLLRPKTNLNDMVVEVDPGTAKGHIEAGDRIPLARTETNVQLDQFLSTLDADTRQYLQLLLAGGAEGVGGHSRQLSGVFRRLKPFAHTVAQLNRAVAQRHVALARVIHDFGLLTNELSHHDAEIQRFVSASDAALGNFAHQQQSIQLALREFPSTLRAVQAGLGASNRFSTVAGPALLKLIPQAQALGPAFKSTKRFFAETTVPIRDQIRPFTREVRPVLTQTARSAKPLEQTVRSFGNALGGFNSFLNELAFKPKGSRQSYLFYLPWLNHDLNSTFSVQDAAGPLGRGVVMYACNGSQLAEGLGAAEPILGTVLEVTRAPRRTELPEIGNAKSFIRCGPNVATTPTTTTSSTK